MSAPPACAISSREMVAGNRRLAEHANIHQYGLMPSLLDDPLNEGGVLTFRVQRTYNCNPPAFVHI